MLTRPVDFGEERLYLFFVQQQFPGLSSTPAAVLCLMVLLCWLWTGGCDTIQNNSETIFVNDTTLGQACLSCHGDSDDRLIVVPRGQWENSAHATTDLLEATVQINGAIRSVAACGPQCHSGNGYVTWVATGGTGTNATPSVINCFTCHLPHTGEYGSWRLDTLRGNTSLVVLKDTAGSAKNFSAGRSTMCANCHQASDIPALTASQILIDPLFGPHFSPQANMLIGAGLYRFDTTDINSHEPARNPDGCNSCHFGTGSGYDFGEHTFALADDESGAEYLANCNVAGCHVATSGPTKIVSDSLHESPRLHTIAALADSLQGRLTAIGLLDGSDSAGIGLLPDSTVPRDAARILHNYLMYRLDGSRGVHNPSAIELLLTESLARLDSLPSASITASDSQICFGSAVQFTSVPSGSVSSFSWDFGDGTPTSIEQNPAHQYDRAGAFTVRLTVLGNAGSRTISKTALITVDTIRAGFTAVPTTGVAPLTVAFSSTSAGATSYAWDFGDPLSVDDTSSLESGSYLYTASGTFTAQLIVFGPCGSDTASQTITVTAGRAATLSSSSPIRQSGR